jgi:hypothetical protein
MILALLATGCSNSVHHSAQFADAVKRVSTAQDELAALEAKMQRLSNEWGKAFRNPELGKAPPIWDEMESTNKEIEELSNQLHAAFFQIDSLAPADSSETEKIVSAKERELERLEGDRRRIEGELRTLGPGSGYPDAVQILTERLGRIGKAIENQQSAVTKAKSLRDEMPRK